MIVHLLQDIQRKYNVWELRREYRRDGFNQKFVDDFRRKDGNRWLNSFVGSTYKERVVNDAFKYLVEQKRRYLGYEPVLQETCLVSITNPTGEIRGIGGSIPGDIILDNFGKVIAGLVRTPATLNKSLSLTDTGNNARAPLVYSAGGDTAFTQAGVAGTRFKVGSSNTAVARADIEIGAAFGTAPESGLFGTGDGSYAAGTITFSSAIAAGGAGTAREAGFYGIWYDNPSAAVRTFMLFHSLASPEQAFVAGNTITVSWSYSV